MFQSEELDNHLKTSHTIKTESVVFAEWNMNDAENVEKLGNYRYRPNTTNNKFSVIPVTYDAVDDGGYYTGATNADITIQSGVAEEDQPVFLTTRNEKMNLLYSLEDCINPHRPRSGINKLLYLGDASSQYLDMGGKDDSTQELLNISNRPRYYMSSRKDPFKYWTSYRTEQENGVQKEYGVSFQENFGDTFYIDDAAPFVVYKDQVPTNKIVVKMQTNVGDIDLGPFRYNNQQLQDPFFGYQNQTTPIKWRIEVLDDDNWVEAISFDANSRDENNEPVIKSDGYVEISYGLNVPFRYRDSYVYAGTLSDESLLPEQAIDGDTFLIKQGENDKGVLKIYDSGEWVTVIPEYNWQLSGQTIDIRSNAVTELTNPDYFINEEGFVQFREFQFIRGIRVVVETMNRPECTFDLIEFSPRLFADISDSVSAIQITKTMSDLGNGSIPVGNIVASTGSLDIFDDDFSFNRNNVFDFETNTGSIVAKYVDKRVRFNFYQVIKEVNSFDYFIPIKVMYTDQIPPVSQSTGLVNISLRDFFFHLESSKAPEILMTDVSISYAITLLLDYMGYSNYVFRRVPNTSEIIIPYFFIAPDQNVAEVLQQLAVASQTAIFFDEYNNLVVMSKEYLLPEEDQRETDSYLYGQEEGQNLPNIINLSSEEKRVYNDGRINYVTRYIQRAISEYSQTPYTDRYKTYGYKPVLLWEVSGKDNLRTQNELAGKAQGYTLSAAPLNSDLSADIPVVENNQIVNNVIDLGENVDAGLGGLSSYQGYLYANGEIIKYDAIEYSISGNLNDGQSGNLRWISSNQEYQRYFAKLPFNGKIYPTGNVRIYAEPDYETVNGITQMKNGAVKKHGRGQFGTPITYHNAGLDSYWSDNNNVFGCIQQSKEYLFNTSQFIDYPETSDKVKAGKNKEISGLGFFDADVSAESSTRNGIIKNFRANKYYTENEANYFSTARVGTIQSSALIFQGPAIPGQVRTSDFVSYVYKDLSSGSTNPSATIRSFIIKYKDGYSPYPLISNRYPQGTQSAQNNIELVLDKELGGENMYRLVSDQTNQTYYDDSFVNNILEQIRQEESVEYIEWDQIITINTKEQTPVPAQYTHFGTRMRIVGKIESTNQKSETPFGAFPIYQTQDLNIDDPEKNIQILGGSGGLGINVNKERNTGYYFEIVSLTQDNINQYTNNDKEQFVSYKILNSPAPSCVNNVVTVRSETNIQFVVGQKIIISGMVDSLNPTDTRTPLNGEYQVTAINEDGKTFQYTIPGDPIANRTSTTGATAFISTNLPNNIANIYFYKVVADTKENRFTHYSISNNVLTLYFNNSARFEKGEKVFIDQALVQGNPPNFSGEKTIKDVSGNTVTIDFQSSDKAKTELIGTVTLVNALAVPYRLWSGTGNIIVDDGRFTGQYRFVGEENPTVYDLAAEYTTVGTAKRFFLYINGKQVATVTDTDPLPDYNGMALFVRGSSRCMFENVYALATNISDNSKVPVAYPISKVWGDDEIDSSESLKKYTLSGMIQKTYLSGINTEGEPSHNLYFDEFGTIMREAAYFNIKYDRAYPALYAKMMKTFNNLKSYATSGFYAGSYGAEFLIFNCTDTNINLDDTTGNFLRIQGIAFTQSTSKTLTVDDYYNKISSLSDPIYRDDNTLYSPLIAREEYNRIINSRSKHGLNEFTMESSYVQTDEAAEDVFGWIIKKISKPKILVGMNTFATFNLQLGDIIEINYKNNDGLDIISEPSKRFVVYNMEYSKTLGEELMTMYLAEV
jgi:hypothetical protein